MRYNTLHHFAHYFQSRNMAQIAALEAEIAKTQKALDSAKATYSSLQKQYQEQCGMFSNSKKN